MLNWCHSCVWVLCVPCGASPRGIVSPVILVSSNSLWEKGAVAEKFCKNGGVSDLETPPSCVSSLPTWHSVLLLAGRQVKVGGKPKGLECACYCTTSTCSLVLIQSLSLESLGAPPKHYSSPPPSKQEIIGGDKGAGTLLRLVFCLPRYCRKLWRWTVLLSFHPLWCSDDKA